MFKQKREFWGNLYRTNETENTRRENYNNTKRDEHETSEKRPFCVDSSSCVITHADSSRVSTAIIRVCLWFCVWFYLSAR